MRFAIKTLNPRPAMTETTVIRDFQGYDAAVEACRDNYRQTLRTSSVCNDTGTVYWHTIFEDGREIDRNFNSGYQPLAQFQG